MMSDFKTSKIGVTHEYRGTLHLLSLGFQVFFYMIYDMSGVILLHYDMNTQCCYKSEGGGEKQVE